MSLKTTLQIPKSLGQMITEVAFPGDLSNHLFFIHFKSGQESLFDTRKGSFLSPPEGLKLPDRKELKLLGALLEKMRIRLEELVDQNVDISREKTLSRYEVCV